MNILCISAYEHSVCQTGVENASTRTVHNFLKNFSNDTDVTQKKFISQLVIQDETWIHHSILSQNNKACNGTNESFKIVVSLHCVTPFFHARMQLTDDR